MHAQPGDWLTLLVNTSGSRREGQIVSVGAGGEPPYRVRWIDDDHESLIFPGPDTEIVHRAPHADAGRATHTP